MARQLYGATSADFTLTAGGRVVAPDGGPPVGGAAGRGLMPTTGKHRATLTFTDPVWLKIVSRWGQRTGVEGVGQAANPRRHQTATTAAWQLRAPHRGKVLTYG